MVCLAEPLVLVHFAVVLIVASTHLQLRVQAGSKYPFSLFALNETALFQL